MTGVEMEHVPYKGGAPAAALLGGQVQVLFAPLVEVLTFIESGKVKALAQPDIKQRFAEQGSDPSGTTLAEFK